MEFEPTLTSQGSAKPASNNADTGAASIAECIECGFPPPYPERSPEPVTTWKTPECAACGGTARADDPNRTTDASGGGS